MPKLDFPSKDIVYAHHLTVPYRPLEAVAEKSVGDGGLDSSLIINGDNLHALKALLTRYGGKVNCVYIDPPYNTGNGEWVYSDRVDSPTMRKWLEANKPVDGEDQERHDKWCCMIWPRLQLLRELLAEDGVIFVSIDDNEQASLKLIMDEIFGEDNFVAQIVVQTNPRGRSLDRHVAKTFEYIILYAKNYHNAATHKVAKSKKAMAEYNKEDENGRYRLLELRNRNPVFNKKTSPTLFFPLYASSEGKVSLHRSDIHNQEVLPLNSRKEPGCWTWSKGKIENESTLLIAKKVSTGFWRVFRKDYLTEESSTTMEKTLWVDKFVNHENGKESLSDLFGTSGSEVPFDFPKSVDLIKKCLRIGSRGNAIVLDSFAGSGTTAQAVMELNKEDGGSRKFILVQMDEKIRGAIANITDQVTAERVRRVIRGVPDAKNEALRKGLGGQFTFCVLGEELSEDGTLSGEKLPSFAALAKHLFYNATGASLSDGDLKCGIDCFIGEHDNYRFYLIYEPNKKFLRSPSSALNSELLEKITAHKTPQKRAVIYSTSKFIRQKELGEGVLWCQLPFCLYGSPLLRIPPTPLERQATEE